MHSLKISPSTSLVPLVALFLGGLSHVAAFTQCYYPDGSIPTDYIWEPCTGAEFSSCCIPSEGDVCQENGLCYYPPYGQVFRGTCSDRTWNDPACPKDICVAGFEDTWTWATSCRSGGDESVVCGTLDGGIHSTANCSAGASPKTDFRTEVSTSKPTRYTSPPPVDTSLYSVFTSKYTTIITADVQTTTLTTTWESTITSTLSQSGYGTATATSGGATGTSAPINGGNNNGSEESKGKVTLSAGVLAAVIAGPIVLIALLAGLFFFLRKKKAMKKESGTRLGSGSDFPPPNGPVGRDQVVPYEVPASESKTAPGVLADKKYLYTGTTQRHDEPRADAYEMGVHGGEKPWGGHHGAAEVSGDAWSRAATPVAPVRSPAPVYSENAGPVIMPVELDGSDSFRERQNAR